MKIEIVKVQENKKHRTVEDKTMARTKMQKRLGRLIKLRALVGKEGWPATDGERNERESDNPVDKRQLKRRQSS